MRILARLAALVVALPGVAVASIESVTFERVLSQATPGLVSYNATLGGGYDLGDIDWTGIVTPLDATTYGYELRMRAWWSGGPQHATIQLGSGYEYPPGTTFTGRSSLLLGVGDPAGTWRFDFYDSYDDGSDGLADQGDHGGMAPHVVRGVAPGNDNGVESGLDFRRHCRRRVCHSRELE